ncbi:MAG: SgcJ/EcaC family oxidoreductase [Acidobacteriota bacterium]|nr:SgcJ/EcaC family oxidoreductase [Acidobacteriota bacterium]
MTLPTLLSLLLVVVSMQSLRAQSPEEQAIRKVFAASDAAWNAHDATQLLDPERTAPDADFINVFGGWVQGRPAFVPIMERLQAGPFHTTSRKTIVDKIKFVRSDVAIAIVSLEDQPEGRPSTTTRGTFVVSKEDGRWIVDSMQNTKVTDVTEAFKSNAK